MFLWRANRRQSNASAILLWGLSELVNWQPATRMNFGGATATKTSRVLSQSGSVMLDWGCQFVLAFVFSFTFQVGLCGCLDANGQKWVSISLSIKKSSDFMLSEIKITHRSSRMPYKDDVWDLVTLHTKGSAESQRTFSRLKLLLVKVICCRTWKLALSSAPKTSLKSETGPVSPPAACLHSANFNPEHLLLHRPVSQGGESSTEGHPNTCTDLFVAAGRSQVSRTNRGEMSFTGWRRYQVTTRK